MTGQHIQQDDQPDLNQPKKPTMRTMKMKRVSKNYVK